MSRYNEIKELESLLKSAQRASRDLQDSRDHWTLGEVSTSLLSAARHLGKLLDEYECAWCGELVEEEGSEYYEGVIHTGCRPENREGA